MTYKIIKKKSERKIKGLKVKYIKNNMYSEKCKLSSLPTQKANTIYQRNQFFVSFL